MIEQCVIAICGLTWVFMSQDPRPGVRRWACVFGLFAQPFWMYATFIAGQWGIFALSFVYTVGWTRGIKTYWIKS